MAFYDLRSFLGKLEAMGDLKRIKAEVDWDEEICAIAQEAIVKGKPALLFENIKDHKDTHGKKVTMNSLGNFERVATALNVSETHPRELLNIWRERLKNPIKPVMVSTGPCKEVIEKGDDINIFEFPFLKIHPQDGGRYIQWHCNVTKDPETGWVNVGMYNSMLSHNYGKKWVSVSPIRTQHMGIHSRKYEALGKPMPYAIAVGTEPVTSMAACAPFGAEVCEYDMAGALRQKPVELVKCETVDLEVPATSEIVIEGTINLDPKTYKPEGPFGRYTGYYVSIMPKDLAPMLEISCITHRKDPIVTNVFGGMGADLVASEAEHIQGLNVCSLLWNELEQMGIRGITGVWCDPDALQTNVFVSIDKAYYGHAKQVANAIWSNSRAIFLGKYVVVVDKDVDIFNLKKINAAIANRTRPNEDIIIYPRTFGNPLDPCADPEYTRKVGVARWDRVLIDATWPDEWEAREEWGGLKHPASCLARPEMIEKARKRWKEIWD